MFKSPYEGNYPVRLMNISLSPMEQLGRMLHSFNLTAYEIEKNKNDFNIRIDSSNTNGFLTMYNSQALFVDSNGFYFITK